ncbi:MAG: hypothetical protein LBU80_04990 [Rikenellaceae bacterium]|jgi:nitrogen regulatory protein PII|nr:hypothetical protein [Rikenellaceae bacterium]
MKAIFISYHQALTEAVMIILDKLRIKGFTQWENVKGRGSETGEPHYGTHTWPSLNTAVLAIVDDGKVEPLLEALRKLDEKTGQQGIRAYVWDIVNQM